MRIVLGLLLWVSTLSLADDSPTLCSIDQWEPFIAEAAHRFEIPAVWIRAILRSESAGCERLSHVPTTSEAGAMGLMQLLPPTWNEYRDRLKLGDNAYAPRDNILAGAAYLRDLYEHYGWPGAAAAYHAGPRRYEEALDHGKPLPPETIEYLARVERAMTQRPAPHTAKPSSESAKASGLFVELRRRQDSTVAREPDSPDVQPQEREGGEVSVR